MHRILLVIAILLLSTAAPSHAQSTSQTSPTIRIEGSTTVYPIMHAIAQHLSTERPDWSLSVTPSGSGTGIDALIGGMADVAMSSRGLLEAEAKKARSKGVDPVRHEVGLDGIVPIVNRANPVSALTVTQLADIYTGRITNWSEVGGDNATITVITRDSSSGTFGIWKDTVLGGARLAPLARYTDSSATMLWDVSVHKYAIGYEGMGYVDTTKVKPLRIDGVAATRQSVLSGSYPLTRRLYLFTDGEPSAELRELIDILQGPVGQDIVRQQGFVPLPSSPASPSDT